MRTQFLKRLAAGAAVTALIFLPILHLKMQVPTSFLRTLGFALAIGIVVGIGYALLGLIFDELPSDEDGSQ